MLIDIGRPRERHFQGSSVISPTSKQVACQEGIGRWGYPSNCRHPEPRLFDRFLQVAYKAEMHSYMADADGQPQRKRARQACLACNARRVKCNVTEKQPCDNCVAGNVACETRESRRGKHPRPSKKRHSIDSSIGSITSPVQGQSQHTDALAGAHVLASLHRNRPSNGFDHSLPDVGSFMKNEQQISPEQDVSTLITRALNSENDR